MSIDYPYPISGFWIFGQAPGQWGATLNDILSLGANKVLQFGPDLVSTTEIEIKSKEPFSRCTIGGTHGFDVLQNHIKQLNPLASPQHIYTLATQENFADDLLVSVFDQKVSIGDDIFWLLVVSGSDPKGELVSLVMNEYDFILVSGRQQDSVTELLAEADTRGMNVYLGMPKAPSEPRDPDPERDRSYEVRQETKPIFFELLNRVLASYRCRHYLRKSFAGLYQSFEIQISDPPVKSVLTLYKEQHSLARVILPRKKILISPYWEARKTKQGREPDSVKKGFVQIAEADVDVIAPQDGRGVGKVGLFWPYQANEMVTAELHPAVGPTTYGEAYHANTRDFYKACREALDELLKGKIELWANIEAFEPGPGTPCGSFTDFQRTTKKRLDHALTFDGGHCSDQVSFMWSSLYECEAGLATPLKEEIRTDWRRPIVVDAFRFQSNGKEGVVIRGYSIAEGHIRLAFYDSNWQLYSRIVPVSSGWIDPDFGTHYNREHRENRYHNRLQEVWVPFEWIGLAPDFWLHIEGINDGGDVSYHVFSLRY